MSLCANVAVKAAKSSSCNHIEVVTTHQMTCGYADRKIHIQIRELATEIAKQPMLYVRAIATLKP